MPMDIWQRQDRAFRAACAYQRPGGERSPVPEEMPEEPLADAKTAPAETEAGDDA